MCYATYTWFTLSTITQLYRNSSIPMATELSKLSLIRINFVGPSMFVCPLDNICLINSHTQETLTDFLGDFILTRYSSGRLPYDHNIFEHVFFLVAKLLYKSKCPSVCQPRLGGNVIFSAPNWDIAPIFWCADSPHKWASIL